VVEIGDIPRPAGERPTHMPVPTSICMSPSLNLHAASTPHDHLFRALRRIGLGETLASADLVAGLTLQSVVNCGASGGGLYIRYACA
jgi:hypothetical protein